MIPKDIPFCLHSSLTLNRLPFLLHLPNLCHQEELPIHLIISPCHLWIPWMVEHYVMDLMEEYDIIMGWQAAVISFWLYPMQQQPMAWLHPIIHVEEHPQVQLLLNVVQKLVVCFLIHPPIHAWQSKVDHPSSMISLLYPLHYFFVHTMHQIPDLGTKRTHTTFSLTHFPLHLHTYCI